MKKKKKREREIHVQWYNVHPQKTKCRKTDPETTKQEYPAAEVRQRAAPDSAEGHSGNLDYVQDKRDTNCLGQVEQRLWAGVDLMSKQQPGKLTMHTSRRHAAYNCSHITVCSVITQHWSLEIIVCDLLLPRLSADSMLYVYLIVSLCTFHFLMSLRQRDTDKLLSICCTSTYSDWFAGIFVEFMQEINRMFIKRARLHLQQKLVFLPWNSWAVWNLSERCALVT